MQQSNGTLPKLQSNQRNRQTERRIGGKGYNRANGPSLLTTPNEAGEISAMLLQPVSCMQRLNSVCRMSSTLPAPASPSYYRENVISDTAAWRTEKR